MPKSFVVVVAFAFQLAVFGAAPGAEAADLPKAKSVSIIVGASAGGSFDVNARVLSRHIGRHLAGAPKVVVQNITGAASLTAVRYLANTAPKDGTAMATFLPGLVTMSIVSPQKVKLDLREFAWVGVVTGDYFRVCYGFGPKGVKSWDELMTRSKDRPFIMGTTGKGASNYVNGRTLQEIFGANLKIIMGFPGSSELRLASERGELDGDCGGFNSIPPAWIKENKAHPFVRFTEKRMVGIPESAIYIGAFARTDEDRKLLDFLHAANDLGRPYIMSKQVSPERVAAMRNAFMATMKDREFLAEMDKLQQPVIPLTGDEAEKIYLNVQNMPASVVARAKKIYD